jgi:DNA excision repair protein ERCC-4
MADDRGHKEAMMKAHSAFGGGNAETESTGEDGDNDAADAGPSRLPISVARPNPNTESGLPDGPALTDASTTLLARAGVIEEEDLDSDTRRWMEEAGLMPESFESAYGLLSPEDAVIIRPYGGEDDDILLQELRPRFVIMYEPNLAFIRRLEVRHRHR